MEKQTKAAHICAYVALILVIIMIVLWACNVGGFAVVTLDSFVGVIVALLAIVVTFAIGWQIYNAMEINKKIEQLNKEISDVKELKSQFESQQYKMEQMRHEAFHFNQMAIAETCITKRDFVGAFRFYQSALRCSLKMDNPKNLEQMVVGMQTAMNNIPSAQNLVPRLYEEVENTDQEIRQSKLFNLIQDRYECAYALFKQRIVKSM